tara:strand:+ start:282 stop:845 length:564 start_codon:yes stop_codon:yes gene_type:complete
MKIKNYELCILIGIAFILSSLQINLCLNLLAMYIICFVISYKCYRNINKSLKYAIFLTCVFYVLKIVLNANNNYFSENFDEKGKSSETKKDISPESLKTLESENDNETLDDTEKDSLNKYLSELNNLDEEHDTKKDIKDMSPAQAQRELYRLIDTTSLLKKTMAEMSPVLNEGKKIMKSIEALNLVS